MDTDRRSCAATGSGSSNHMCTISYSPGNRPSGGQLEAGASFTDEYE